MIKTIKENQVEYLPLERLTLGMVTPDGIILSLDFDRRTYATPLSTLQVDPGRTVAVLCRVTEDMVTVTQEAAKNRRGV